MKQLGRIHWMVPVGVVGLLALIAIMLLGGSTPNMVAGNFLVALAKGDVNKLVDLTYIGSDSKEHLRKEWEFATKVAGPHYRFTWRIVNYVQQGPNNASVRLEFVRNAFSPSAYPDNYELPLVKEDGRWKVRATAISREIYPALPR